MIGPGPFAGQLQSTSVPERALNENETFCLFLFHATSYPLPLFPTSLCLQRQDIEIIFQVRNGYPQQKENTRESLCGAIG